MNTQHKVGIQMHTSFHKKENPGQQQDFLKKITIQQQFPKMLKIYKELIILIAQNNMFSSRLVEKVLCLVSYGLVHLKVCRVQGKGQAKYCTPQRRGS
jgi:hypothetical protein